MILPCACEGVGVEIECDCEVVFRLGVLVKGWGLILGVLLKGCLDWVCF